MANCSRWRFLRSKEAIVIIIWYAVISLWLQGNGFAPIFMLSINSKAGQWVYTIGIIVSFPIIGLLGDMWIGRYKIINFSLWLKWMTVVIVTLISSLIFVVKFTSLQLTALIVTLTLLEQIGFAAFQVTAIQFGTDQLQGVPVRYLSSFISWYIWVEQIATPITEWISYTLFQCSRDVQIWTVFAWSLVVACLLTTILSTKSYFMTNWFVKEPGSPNPYRLVYHVLKFAWKHKHPVQRTALTYFEDKKPSRIDYGKCKYGGPFTTEEVENVKKLLKLSAVLFSLFGIFIAAFSIQLDWQVLVMQHIGRRNPGDHDVPKDINAQLYETVCDTVVLGSLIPIHELIVYPLLHKYIPSMIKRIWIGGALTVACTVSILILDAIGHTVLGSADLCFILHPFAPLNISRYFVLFPTALYGLSVITFNIALLEFIVIRSPHSMKGILLGLFYTLRFGITECFPLGLSYVFDFPNRRAHLSCGSAYYLMLSLVALVSLVAFTIVAYILKDWDQSSEEIDVPSFAEDDGEVIP